MNCSGKAEKPLIIDRPSTPARNAEDGVPPMTFQIGSDCCTGLAVSTTSGGGPLETVLTQYATPGPRFDREGGCPSTSTVAP